ncbi:hypothetical protein BU23DRAFT_652990 [Bimuria novae-zelandiae CBS 107.79]|uniref:Enoyl reductase (ER) domain-containing protein n=1 Tax=Bimuria novae-zelandiae CBS 107.79 TaxID=1447943 RepID=A0A6A5UYG1_9PLEO|nr:hypothetical protein BU23DRAFT_652990 [Bimuria novae-zelandiae CBS 107.79]
MRAARYYGKEDIRIEDVEVAECGEGQVRVAPAYVGICGTDLHEYLGGPTFAPVEPHPISGDTIPIVLGHEFSGTITEVGPGVSQFKPGQHVVLAETVPDSTVLVLGGGPIGLAVVQCLVALKTKKIIMSEVSKTRQRFAREFGAHHVLCPKTYDLVAISKELSGKDGPDVVFDCAGVPASLVTACKAVKARGTVVNVAIWEREVPFQPNMLVFKEAHYTAVLGYQREDFQAVIDHLAKGTLKPEKMITSTIQLDNVVEGGIKALIKDKESHVKILVEVGGE